MKHSRVATDESDTVQQKRRSKVGTPYTCPGCGEVLRHMHCMGTHGQYSKTCTAEMRFWGKVDKSGGPDACWPWLGVLQPDGYGQTGVNRKTKNSHKHAYELVKGPVPAGLQIRHSCDVRHCCNPGHMSLGTHQDNMHDMDARKRRRNQYGPPRRYKEGGSMNDERSDKSRSFDHPELQRSVGMLCNECGDMTGSHTPDCPSRVTNTRNGETPRTDAEQRKTYGQKGIHPGDLQAMVNLARQLERELAEVKEELSLTNSTLQSRERNLEGVTNKHNYEPPANMDEALTCINVLRDELARICVLVGRSKDGSGFDVDWYDLHADVAALARSSTSSDKPAWQPTPDFPVFDENALAYEIHRIWGKHGAHAEVLRMLIARSARTSGKWCHATQEFDCPDYVTCNTAGWCTRDTDSRATTGEKK